MKSPFYWSDEAHEAAERLAEGREDLGVIAEAIGMTPKTLYNWRLHPEFAARIKELADLRRSEARRVGIAEREQRLTAIRSDFDRLDQIMAARAKDPNLAALPGGSTGLVTQGPNGRSVLDTKLLKARLLLMQAMAVELGEWKVKAETGAVDIETAVKRTRDAGAEYAELPDDSDPTDEEEPDAD